MIQPAPGVMIEQEWPAWLPRETLFPVGRIRLTGATAEGYAAVAAAAPATARDLASAGAGVIAYACTVGSLFAGAGAERVLIADLTGAAGKPAISLADTSIRALAAVGARAIAIMTPYDDATNRWVADYVVERGLAVAGFVPTPVSIVTVGDMSAAEVTAIAIAAMARLPDADALWIPCTAIRTMAAVATIEAVTRRPVISGTQALLWHALGVLGIADPVRGAGVLFERKPG